MQDKGLFKRITSFLLDSRTLQVIAQIIFVIVAVLVFYRLAGNVLDQLAQKNISPSLNFFKDRAGFELADSGSYTPDNSYAEAFKVGVTNTIRVVIVGLVVTTIIGVIGGILLLSHNWVVRNITRIIVEIVHDTPLLMQLFIWYYVVLLALPPLRQALQVPATNIVVIPARWLVYIVALIVLSRLIRRLKDESPWRLFAPVIAVIAIIAIEILNLVPIPLARLAVQPFVLLSNRGLALPALAQGEGFTTWLAFAIAGLVLGIIVYAILGFVRDQTGRRTPRGLIGLLIWIAAMLLGWVVAGGGPISASLPARTGLRYSNGTILLPEYTALLLGLAIYTAAYIAEIVRAGIQAVPHGQIEASRALGLTYLETLRLIILPQALRVIIPPLGNQYLNLSKNSSLGVAIAFTEVFQVTSTIINQSGQAVTGILLIMACYLTLSLIISAGLNVINRRFQLVTR